MSKSVVVKLRVSEEERGRWQAVADREYEGNLSLFVRIAAGRMFPDEEVRPRRRKKPRLGNYR